MFRGLDYEDAETTKCHVKVYVMRRPAEYETRARRRIRLRLGLPVANIAGGSINECSVAVKGERPIQWGADMFERDMRLNMLAYWSLH